MDTPHTATPIGHSPAVSTPLGTALRWMIHALLYLLIAVTAIRTVVAWQAGPLSTHRGGLILALLYALPLPGGIAALALVTLLAITGHARWAGTDATTAGLLGPLIGAAVALAVVLAVRALQHEVAERTRLAEELLAARSEIARHEREAATTAERHRIARELHDTVGQSALSIQIMLDAALHQDPTENPDHQRELLQQARSAAARTSAQARRIVDEDAPPSAPHTTPRAHGRASRPPFALSRLSSSSFGLPVCGRAHSSGTKPQARRSAQNTSNSSSPVRSGTTEYPPPSGR